MAYSIHVPITIRFRNWIKIQLNFKRSVAILVIRINYNVMNTNEYSTVYMYDGCFISS